MMDVRILSFILVVITANLSVGQDQCTGDTCEEEEPLIPHDPTQPSVFDDLSETEIRQVLDYLFKTFSIHTLSRATPDQPIAMVIERLQNKKDDVLDFLDNGGPMPRREARAVLYRPDLAEPVIEEYRIFPIPKPTQHEQIINSKWRHPIPLSARSIVNLSYLTAIGKAAVEEFKKFEHILAAATGGYKFHNCQQRCLTFIPFPAYNSVDQWRIMISVYRLLEGDSLYPVGVELAYNIQPYASSDWAFERIWFQGKIFFSTEELINAYAADNFVPQGSPEPSGAHNVFLAGSMNFRGDPLPKKPRQGPKSYYPDGRRYSLDGHHIRWQGWSFHVNQRTTSGPMFHDIRFRDERIVYELSLQEIAVFYSGGSPTPLYSLLFDSNSFMSTFVSQLFKGVDCPEEATYLDVVHYMGTPRTFPDAICVFEMDKGIPLRRHYKGNYAVPGFQYFQGMRDIVLVTRTILSLGNYDYIVDLILHQTGQIETKISLTGYTLNSFYTGPEMDMYGHETQPKSIANLHQHLVNFRVDMDIAGRENRFHTLDLKTEPIEDHFMGRETLHTYFTKSLKKTEEEGAYKFNFDTPKYLIVYNENSTNKYGNQRGYRIQSNSMSKVLIPEDHPNNRSWAWAKYQTAVTRYHDDEVRCSSFYAGQTPFDPIVSFQDFIDDNETIVDQDLVTWITLGTHHIPHSEDVPVVNTPGVQLTFFLQPYNFFNEDPSLASRDNVRVHQSKFGTDVYTYAGIDASKSMRCFIASAGLRDVQCCFTLFVTVLWSVFRF